MTANQKKLINLLKEMFQFDQADLDFGIYRIMRMKREEISRFIEEDLPAQITNELRELVSVSAEVDMAEIDKQVTDAKSLNISETAKRCLSGNSNGILRATHLIISSIRIWVNSCVENWTFI